MKICIVTPDLSGPMTNGGIGTAVYYLAKFAREELNLPLDVLYTGAIAVKNANYWKEHFRHEFGFEFFCQEDFPPLPSEPILDSLWVNTRAMQVHEWLVYRNYDQIHFQDYQANGFVAMQAKRAGIAYNKTLLTCTLHSSIEWMKEGNGCFAARTIEEMVQQYMEHYCAATADLVVSPTQYMVEWIRAKVPQLGPVRIVQNLYKKKSVGRSKDNSVHELCFFGRLETRKGLEIFTGALEMLASSKGTSAFPRITFLGRPGNMSSGQNPIQYLHNFAKRTGVSIEIKDNLSADEAITYLRNTSGAVAILPSLIDNLPYVVVECLQDGIPFIASCVGGVPELVLNQNNLFDANEKSLYAKILSILDQGVSEPESGYDINGALKAWGEIFTMRAKPASIRSCRQRPDVTVCIPYFNYADYLPEALDSLVSQTETGFDVVVVNDGSTDKRAIEVFAEMKEKYASFSGWRFISTPNQGICAARNYAASLANTKYLLFLDADNIAEKDIVETFLNGMENSDLDCLTSYNTYFSESNHRRTKCYYRPVGPCLEVGLYYNIFGDATFIVRKDVFEKIGGFTDRGRVSFEDWEFLANLSLSGYKQDVIPKSLIKYRFTSGGFSRNTSLYRNFRRIIDRYSLHVPRWTAALLSGTYSAIRSEVYYAFPPPNIAPPAAVGLKRRVRDYYRIEHHDGFPRVALRFPLPKGFVPIAQKIRRFLNRFLP